MQLRAHRQRLRLGNGRLENVHALPFAKRRTDQSRHHVQLELAGSTPLGLELLRRAPEQGPEQELLCEEPVPVREELAQVSVSPRLREEPALAQGLLRQREERVQARVQVRVRRHE